MKNYIKDLYDKNIKFVFSTEEKPIDEQNLTGGIKCNPSQDIINFCKNHLEITRAWGETEKYNYDKIDGVLDGGEVAHKKDKINGQKVYKLPTR